MRAVNHPQVQFLYDMFHEQIAEGNLIEKLDKHIDVIGLIHIADVPGRHEPGTGEINYANITQARPAQLQAHRGHGIPSRRRSRRDPAGRARDGREVSFRLSERSPRR